MWQKKDKIKNVTHFFLKKIQCHSTDLIIPKDTSYNCWPVNQNPIRHVHDVTLQSYRFS